MNEGQYGKAPSLFMQLHGCLHFISFLFYCFCFNVGTYQDQEDLLFPSQCIL